MKENDLKIITNFPRQVREIENTFIPLAEGIRLAARIWLPEDAETDPVPAIFEFLPYRKRDGTSERDALTHPYYAGHGYACVRVDMLGAGDSEGILEDEYLKTEQDDALEVLDWIALVYRRNWYCWDFLGWIQWAPDCSPSATFVESYRYYRLHG